MYMYVLVLFVPGALAASLEWSVDGNSEKQ